MSRIGSQPVPVSDGVEVSITGTDIKVKGPKGSRTGVLAIHHLVEVLGIFDISRFHLDLPLLTA